jgi:uncharacterized protein YegP (UPF0339 family)
MATFILKRDSLDDYYWIVKSDNNGKIIAKSSESYESKEGAKESIAWVKTNAKDAFVKDETTKLGLHR